MNNKAVVSDDRVVSLYRDGKEIESGSMYQPGESLTMHISDSNDQFVFEASDGHFTDKKSGCKGKRIADKNDVEIIMPSGNDIGEVRVSAGWAVGHAKVLISKPFFVVPVNNKDESETNTKKSGKSPDINRLYEDKARKLAGPPNVMPEPKEPDIPVPNRHLTHDHNTPDVHEDNSHNHNADHDSHTHEYKTPDVHEDNSHNHKSEPDADSLGHLEDETHHEAIHHDHPHTDEHAHGITHHEPVHPAHSLSNLHKDVVHSDHITDHDPVHASETVHEHDHNEIQHPVLHSDHHLPNHQPNLHTDHHQPNLHTDHHQPNLHTDHHLSNHQPDIHSGHKFVHNIDHHKSDHHKPDPKEVIDHHDEEDPADNPNSFHRSDHLNKFDPIDQLSRLHGLLKRNEHLPNHPSVTVDKIKDDHPDIIYSKSKNNLRSELHKDFPSKKK